MTAQSKNFSEIGGQAAALMLTGLKAITGVTETLTARHVDPFGDEGEHEHTWHITALYAAEPFRDGRALKAGLRKLLDSFPAVLPRELWAGEDIAKRVLLLPECIGARVWRSEGFEAWAFADATIVAALRELSALKEEVERLREALEPFAKGANAFDLITPGGLGRPCPDAATYCEGDEVTVGDFRRASNGAQFAMLADAAAQAPKSNQWRGYWQRRAD